jgi:hypothetical protein
VAGNIFRVGFVRYVGVKQRRGVTRNLYVVGQGQYYLRTDKRICDNVKKVNGNDERGTLVTTVPAPDDDNDDKRVCSIW